MSVERPDVAMASMFRRIFAGLRTVGPRYLLRVVPNEFARPRLSLTRRIRGALIAAGDRLSSPAEASLAWSDDCLQFFYDLAAAPLTFDFATYLAAAETERRLRGLAGINVIFVLGPFHGVRQETPPYEALLDHHARLWRLRHILIPMLAFLPSVRGHALCADRKQAAALMTGDPGRLYPPDYRVFLPRQPAPADLREHARRGTAIWPLFRSTEHGSRLADEFLAREASGRRAIVITLRNSDVSPARNSSLPDWLAFADGLDRSRYAPIFLYDSDTMMRAQTLPPHHLVCEAASWNLELRMGLYERAWLNMALMHGPMELCWYNERARYVIFMPVGADPVTSPDMLREAGHVIGRDLEFATPCQHLVWQTDELPAIRTAFAGMEARIALETAGAAPR